MRPIKSLALAGGLVAAALVGGTLMSAVLAAPPAATTPTTTTPTTADPASMATYCQTFLDAFAGQLGTTSDKVTAAARTAAKAAIDAAVKAGDLTAAQATAMKARIDAATG